MRYKRSSECGSVLVIAVVVAVVLAGLAVSVLRIVTAAEQEESFHAAQLERLYVAEAGLMSSLADLSSGGDGNLGSATVPVNFSGGTFFTTTTDNGDGTFTLRTTGAAQGGTRRLEGIVRRTGGVFQNSIFAGNSSGDPTYVLKFAGTGDQADEINGDVFSGGDILVTGDADVNGTARATGTITGMMGEEEQTQPLPDIAGMDYPHNHDVNVVAEFAAHASYNSDDAGGSAWQVPEEYASHIFRRNPSDRKTEYESTAKPDYFLEDPYETVREDANWDGTDAYEITLSGTGSEPGPDSNNSVFYVDGNMWIHNSPTFSFKFVNGSGDPTRVTFVVRGNIYISDNIFYQDMETDGVALIAIKDENVADSGNIYFGDPRGGTLETMHAYMYAENNFETNNLDEAGSDEVTVFGTMSAGNQVNLDRAFANQYSKFVMNFDDRVMTGELSLPGLPEAQGELEYSLVLWREITDSL